MKLCRCQRGRERKKMGKFSSCINKFLNSIVYLLLQHDNCETCHSTLQFWSSRLQKMLWENVRGGECENKLELRARQKKNVWKFFILYAQKITCRPIIAICVRETGVVGWKLINLKKFSHARCWILNSDYTFIHLTSSRLGLIRIFFCLFFHLKLIHLLYVIV